MKNLRRILVVTADSLATKMAGPAIRAFEIAKALAPLADVRLVSTVHASLESPDFSIAAVGENELQELVKWSDVIVFQGHLLASFPWIKDTDKIIVADIYDPMHLEQLEQGIGLSPTDRIAQGLDVVHVLNDQIIRADFMVCASEKQRDFWMGQLAALGRVNAETYDMDASLRSLLDVAPFGVANDSPIQKRHAIKGAIDGIAADDKVVLWGGGIYNWFDPLTLIRAVDALAKRRPNVRLFFLGVQHPNPHVPTMKMAADAQALAADLGILNTVVFFNEGWVPYDERADFLLDADVGVSTHLDHLETAYSFRTRILDYLWASLPVVSTAGDTFADLIVQHDLGLVVPPADVSAAELALESLLFNDSEHARVQANVAQFAQTMTWATSLKPLIEFCLTGKRAPDIAAAIPLAGSDRIVDLTTRVAGLEASASWRVTAPIRAVSKRLRAFSRR